MGPRGATASSDGWQARERMGLTVNGKHQRTRIYGVTTAKLAGILLALFALTGCIGSYTRSGTVKGQPVVGPFQGKEENPLRHRGDDQASQKAMVQLVGWQVTIPNQGQAQAEELWKLLKPATLLVNNSGLLERNGLAIGSGDELVWTKTLSNLDTGPNKQGPGANRVKEEKTLLPEGYVAEIALTASPSSPTLFWHEADGTLVGRTYENCKKLLAITATAQPRGQVHIKLTPALKGQSARVQSLRRLALLSGMDLEKYVARFELLAVEATVSPDEFLMIGSVARAGSGSFGRAFFDDVNEQQPSRTVLLIIPRVISPAEAE